MKLATPSFFLRAESLAIFIAATALYLHFGGNWLYFLALFLAPDVGMAGYLLNPRAGSATYNITHSYLLPIAVAGILYASQTSFALYSLVWIAHIGFDRAIGFGLKYPTGFKDTHMQRV